MHELVPQHVVRVLAVGSCQLWVLVSCGCVLGQTIRECLRLRSLRQQMAQQ